MLAALGMLAYIASIMTHEALGHGGYCLAAGGHNTMLTGWWETCRSQARLNLESRQLVPLSSSVLVWWPG